MKKEDEEFFSEEETQQRLRKILKGAFAGPPQPLKAIPTRHGKRRAQTKKSPQGRKATGSAEP